MAMIARIDYYHRYTIWRIGLSLSKKERKMVKAISECVAIHMTAYGLPCDSVCTSGNTANDTLEIEIKHFLARMFMKCHPHQTS